MIGLFNGIIQYIYLMRGMSIVAILKKKDVYCMKEAVKKEGDTCKVFTGNTDNTGLIKKGEIVTALQNATIIFVETGVSGFGSDLEHMILERAQSIPVVFLGPQKPLCEYPVLSETAQEQCNRYFSYGGKENLQNLIRYVKKTSFGTNNEIAPPSKIPRQGIYHPDAPNVFENSDEYRRWYKKKGADSIGLLIDQTLWANQDLAVEDSLIKCLESHEINVIPVFTDALISDELGSIGLTKCIRSFFLDQGRPRIAGIINLLSVIADPFDPVDEQREPFRMCTELIKEMNIPVFQPIISYYQSLEEWRALKGLVEDVPWAVSLPEYDGVIEPVIIGSTFEKPGSDGKRIPLPDRCERVAGRIKRWIRLKNTPKSMRKVVFMLNNSPCHSVEATVGSASHMNGLQSMVNLLNRLKEEGYTVEGIPTDGQALIREILDRRAISEFRWTTVQDIVAKGGALAQIPVDEYNKWYDTLDPVFREKVNSIWGVPPGEGMVLDGKLLITGVKFGNVLVCCQPKRGCYGPKCDGKVCKILHDPMCPPPHQYLATYHYLEEVYNADVLIHLGTHGSLELTPGNGVGMSRACSPDVAIGDIPYLYIYNANNPPEGALSKRRTYATLVDHMISVMDQSELYEKLEDLDELLREYETLTDNPARKKALEDLIRNSIHEINFEKDLHLSATDSFDTLKGKAHEILSKIRNTQIVRDVHIFGEIPQGSKRVDFINNIIRFDIGDQCIRRVIAEIEGMDFDDLFSNQDKFSKTFKKSYGEIIEGLDVQAKSFIQATLEDPAFEIKNFFKNIITIEQENKLRNIQLRILDINERLDQSKEIDALLNGMDSGHTPPGPSGYLTRGQDDILPTGRNFYSTDPYRTPTKAAWIVGKNLAESLLQKFIKEEGRLPENVGFFWMAMDLMCANGEAFAQMFHLIGVEPVWNHSGQVRSFRIVPLEKLGRPRIDITIEITSTLRDCYPTCYELLDKAICTVASLDESPDMNYIRKHSLASQQADDADWRNATLRIFSNPPGAYTTGVALAVHASAWENEKDLVDVFLTTHSYAYGKDYAGILKPEQMARNLSTVEVTFDKTATDSCDLLGCCCFFGNHGGMTVAARHFNPKDVKAYYGDTREPDHVFVHDVADEIRRVTRSKTLNPKWIEAMKKAGYNGAAAISSRTEHLMGWQASTGEVDSWIFDEITKTYVLNPEMKEFFQEKNPYAFEELTRRLLETEKRGLWDADPEVLEKLRETYLEIESWLEDDVGDGDHQGGSVDIITSRDVGVWGDSVKAVTDKVDKEQISRFLSINSGH